MDFVRTLKALADPIRLRVLAAVAEEELTVGEVQEVVESVQSSVSRNLAILRDAGFVQDRKEGDDMLLLCPTSMLEPAGEFFKSLQARMAELPEAKGDRARLEDCRRRRLHRSQGYSNRWPVTGSAFAKTILTIGSPLLPSKSCCLAILSLPTSDAEPGA